ncbi:DNA-3-methyladenine glycosylase family protein [Cellulomonas chitinilytica]|uniref:DNA-3-methyladenine glycosylase family protein n=1 Tax=Cellulomonas chitinilytica TaxID=398759 RepID=UPI001EF2986F|nr:DNA-3-methyladenine glycosylase 2 family protein [Cellulomonas chitinilytica]
MLPLVAPPDDERVLRTVYRPRAPVDVRLTLSPLRRGAGDPTWASTPDGALWWATSNAAGPATLHLHVRRDGVHATAWGPGAERAVDGVPALLGAGDDPTGFRADLHPLVREAHRRLPGLRIPRSGQVLEALVPAILEQRVVGLDARASWRRLVLRHGTPAPGPAPSGMRVAPSAPVWRDLPVWEWRRAGVEEARSGTVRRAATVARGLQAGADLPLDEARRRLLTVRGVGPWTVAEVASRALGDADAVSVGDFHLAHLVGWALTGRRTDDAGMLGLLEPWRGHRQRVIRLLEITQASRAPRFGPRAPRARPLV